MTQKPNDQVILKILLPMIILLAAIYIFRSGYSTGAWLHTITHK